METTAAPATAADRTAVQVLRALVVDALRVCDADADRVLLLHAPGLVRDDGGVTVLPQTLEDWVRLQLEARTGALSPGLPNERGLIRLLTQLQRTLPLLLALVRGSPSSVNPLLFLLGLALSSRSRRIALCGCACLADFSVLLLQLERSDPASELFGRFAWWFLGQGEVECAAESLALAGSAAPPATNPILTGELRGQGIRAILACFGAHRRSAGVDAVRLFLWLSSLHPDAAVFVGLLKPVEDAARVLRSRLFATVAQPGDALTPLIDMCFVVFDFMHHLLAHALQLHNALVRVLRGEDHRESRSAPYASPAGRGVEVSGASTAVLNADGFLSVAHLSGSWTVAEARRVLEAVPFRCIECAGENFLLNTALSRHRWLPHWRLLAESLVRHPELGVRASSLPVLLTDVARVFMDEVRSQGRGGVDATRSANV